MIKTVFEKINDERNQKSDECKNEGIKAKNEDSNMK